jgi:hypothetical protein
VNLKRMFLGLLTWLMYAAAALFLAGLAAVAVLYFTTALNRQSARDIWGLLRGEKVAVAPEDRGELATLKAQAKSHSAVEQAEADASGQARQELERRSAQVEAEAEKERRFLKLLSEQLTAREKQLGLDAGRLADGQKQLALAQKIFKDQKDETSLRKVLKLYAGMDAEIIAGDFEARLAGGGNTPQFNEVVEILRRMPERQASEVLAAISKPDLRNRLMEELKKS